MEFAGVAGLLAFFLLTFKRNIRIGLRRVDGAKLEHDGGLNLPQQPVRGGVR